MNHLWSPWRKEYIENHERPAGCIFCELVKQEDGPGNLVVYRGESVYVVLNRYPYTGGHLMVVPYVHQPALNLLDYASMSELIDLVSRSTTVLKKVYNPAGFNFGANEGTVAGAGVADHFHMHVVPRWNGDTNFMSTISETRVISEALEEAYQRIRSAWKSG